MLHSELPYIFGCLFDIEKLSFIGFTSFGFAQTTIHDFQNIVFNPLPDMPILGCLNSAANKDRMSRIWTNVGFSYLI